ncbi:hypothetical protein [Neisseria sp.]|uniref:hypothetical protein n=1 Tax=Neisseria sp. TaxID=192066 RepID=UPI0026DC48B3|nr:hypothetical protein [Neisseria sp.]MDO4908193.1 hypothetical protein [Neisseria sp.]
MKPKYAINNEVKLKSGHVVLINGIDQEGYGKYFYDYQSDNGIGRIPEADILEVIKEDYYAEE